MTVSLTVIAIVIIFFIISLGLNFYLFFSVTHKSDSVTFEETFSVFNNVIDNQKIKFLAGLRSLSKKYAVMTNDGYVKPPTDIVEKYSKEKQELKTAVVKKVVRSLSKKIRSKILSYYSETGMIDYIIIELDKSPSSEKEGSE